jgi:sensor c-di-GMP phosphodiesterase-like protein
MNVVTALADVEKKEIELKNANEKHKLELEQQLAEAKLAKDEALKAKQRAASMAEAEAKKDLQVVLNLIQEAELARKKSVTDAELAKERELAAIEETKNKAYAETVKEIMGAISPDLIAALSTKANADLLVEATKNMSPYAIANGMPVADTINTLMRGTTLEGVIDKALENGKLF